jgi:hypothetical protein
MITSCRTPPYHSHTLLSTGPRNREYYKGHQLAHLHVYSRRRRADVIDDARQRVRMIAKKE